MNERAVVDGDLITAGPQSPVQFARATLGRLRLASDDTRIGAFLPSERERERRECVTADSTRAWPVGGRASQLTVAFRTTRRSLTFRPSSTNCTPALSGR
jgi:hypothetical protein